MDLYSQLLEKTREPQPSLQKLAVISIFEKIRSLPPSPAGVDAVSRCLRSTSPAIIDQSTRELCRLVKDSKFDLPTVLLELQSALDDSHDSQFVGVFVKSIGFLVRLGFQEKPLEFRFESSEVHPFVKILSCGPGVQSELVKQVILFIVKCKHFGMDAVCRFLSPFLNYLIIKSNISGSNSAFTRNLVSTLAAFCCSFPQEAIPIMKLLTGRLKYFQCKNAEEVIILSYIIECLVDAYIVVLKQLVGMRLLVHEAQLCGLELVEVILSLHRDFRKCSGCVEKILNLSRHLLAVQKELSLNYVTEFSSVMLSVFPILIQSELEHEQYLVLKLVLFLLRWKSEIEHHSETAANELPEELLFIFPVLALVSSPSRKIKQTATDLISLLGKIATTLLTTQKDKLFTTRKQLSITTSGHIIFRFLENLWFEYQSSSLDLIYVNNFSKCDSEDHCKVKAWTSSVRKYCMGIVEKRKSTAPISQSEENFLAEMPLQLFSIASVLLLHRNGISAVDLLAIGSSMEPRIGVPLLLVILLYNHIFSSEEKDNDFHDTLLKLLILLPPLASHHAMIPLVIQIILPMLQKDENPVMKATAIRLICKTWAVNDRIFGSLQGVLHQKGLQQFASEREICISIAVSIRDVCQTNPDRGVDLILSVEACVENHDPLVQSLGLQSLAHLCEADVIDFYTAWEVIATHVQNHLENAVIAHGLSHLLKWGGIDAEAYSEAAANVLNILWDIGTCKEINQSWTRAKIAAFNALSQYEVVHIQRSVPEFSSRNMEFLISQANPELATAVEEFQIKIINHEHTTRRRNVKQKRVSGSKIVKLLNVVPDVIFNKGLSHKTKELPGAALFCLPIHKDTKNQGASKGLQDVHAKYETAVSEIAASLHLSRNVCLALLSLQSWKPFMQRWMKSCIMGLEANVNSNVLDKTSKAANDILKVITRLAETAIPRSAENFALALGAFCLVLPPSAHSVKSMASRFLLNWVSQYEHEYRQWSAAISLGSISSCLHVTDHKQKFENINALLKVASVTKSTLVKGACGIGLGFSCQDLLNTVDSEINTEKETKKTQEIELLRKIIKTLIQITCQFTGSSHDILENLASYFPLGKDKSSLPPGEGFNPLEEDAWSNAGPIIGLGNCLGALYRAGAHDAVIYLKSLIGSWIFSENNLFSSPGACLALPSVVFFCEKVELIDGSELDHYFDGFVDLISRLLSVEQSGALHQSVLVAACIGAGNLVSVILNGGVHSLRAERVENLLGLFRRIYSSPNNPIVHLGAMTGAVNAMGAGAGTTVQSSASPFLNTTFDQKDSSSVSGPLLSNQAVEPTLISIIQDIFLVAQSSADPQLQHYASWAVSFLRHSVFSIKSSSESNVEQIDSGIPKDGLVMKLSLWLKQMDISELGTGINIGTVASALRILSHAPRLPPLDWGAVIRRCMKHGGQMTKMPPRNSPSLREECVLFSLSCANQSDPLLVFLDELSDLARLKNLEQNLQPIMFVHLADLLKVFSDSRAAKLFDDVAAFLHWSVSSDRFENERKIELRVSCWKGLSHCLDESDFEKRDCANILERCMEVLFTMLSQCNRNFDVEWSEAIGCLGKARKSWLSDLLMISDANFKEDNNQLLLTLKKIRAKAALVRIGSIPLLELAKWKAYMLNISSEVIWNVLLEVTLTLQHSEENVRRQWIVDTAEILCVTSYPSTALGFLGLLSGSSCKYMPVLVADKFSVLSDLPVTLSSLLVGTIWEIVAESVALFIWRSTERIYDWSRRVENDDYLGGSQPIDASENDMADLLLQVTHSTCVALKDYLPVEKQLRLANMKYRSVLI